MREMYPDLVRAPGFKLHTYIGVSGKALDNAVVRNGRLPVPLHAHPEAIDRVPPDRFIDRAAPGQDPGTDREVMSRDLPFGQRAHQGGVRLQRFRD